MGLPVSKINGTGKIYRADTIDDQPQSLLPPEIKCERTTYLPSPNPEHCPPDIPALRHCRIAVSHLPLAWPKLRKFSWTYMFGTVISQTDVEIQATIAAGESWVVAGASVAVDDHAAAISINGRERGGQCS